MLFSLGICFHPIGR